MWQRFWRFLKIRIAKKALLGEDKTWERWLKWHLPYWRHRHDVWHVLLDSHSIAPKQVQRLLEAGFNPNLSSFSGKLFIEEVSLITLVSNLESFKPFVVKAPRLPYLKWVEEEASTDFQSLLSEDERYIAQLERLFEWGISQAHTPSDLYSPLVQLIQDHLVQLAKIRAWFDKASTSISRSDPVDIGMQRLSVGQLQMQIHRSCQLITQLMAKPGFEETMLKEHLETPDFSGLLEPLMGTFLPAQAEQEIRALSLKLHLETTLKPTEYQRRPHRL